MSLRIKCFMKSTLNTRKKYEYVVSMTADGSTYYFVARYAAVSKSFV